MADVFRVTTYRIDPTNWASASAATYTLTLNNNLEANYFAMVHFAAGGASSDGTNPRDAQARISADPFGTGDLGTTTGSNELELSRGNGATGFNVNAQPETVVTVVECLDAASTKGFTLRTVHEASWGSTSNTTITDNIGASVWTDIDQVLLLGGYRGGGCEINSTASGGCAASNARIYPSDSGSDSIINMARDLTGKTGVDVKYSVYVVEWGSEWYLERVTVTGSAGGGGANATGEYDTGAIFPITRDNTFVLGWGHCADGGIGDSFFGTLITLGDGVNQAASESTVAVGQEYSDSRTVDVTVLNHADLAVDYRFKTDADSTAFTYDHTVDAALSTETYGTNGDGDAYTEGYRMGIQYHGCNGTGNAFHRPVWGPRHTASGTLTVTRGYNGQNWPAWVQSVDFSGIQTSAAAPRRIFHIS